MEEKGLKISDLIPDDKNFNKGTEYGNSLIEKSFRKFGAGRSILIDKNNRVIAGNKSIENAAAIGIEDLQIVESDGKRIIAVRRNDIDLDTPEGREMALADNASAKANIVFDAELVEAELGVAVCEEWGIESSVKLEAEEDDFTVPEGGSDTDIVLGDLFEIGQHRLLCGDSTCSDTVAKLMNGQKADMLFTDPPYNVDYEGKTKEKLKIQNDNIKDFDQFLKDAFVSADTAMKDGAVYYIAHPDIFAYEFIGAVRHCGWKQARPAVVQWVKNSIVMGRGDYHSQSEPLLYGWKDGSAHFKVLTRDQSNVWKLDRPSRSSEHPTMKPVELVAKAIKNHSVGLILDLFLGSGTTMVASHQLNRKCCGMELDPKYCQVIIDRMIKLDPTLPIKKNGEPYTKQSNAEA